MMPMFERLLDRIGQDDASRNTAVLEIYMLLSIQQTTEETLPYLDTKIAEFDAIADASPAHKRNTQEFKRLRNLLAQYRVFLIDEIGTEGGLQDPHCSPPASAPP